MFQLPKIKPDEILMYLRKSRADDPTLTVEEVLAKHEQMLDEWVARVLPGERVPEENRYREVLSGETIESRPEVQRVLRLVESPRYRAVLIVEPQRLSRGDLEDIGRLTKLLRYSGTMVLTLQYNYDLTDPHDRDSFERELKRGNEFLEYQKRIMNNGRLLAVSNGCFIGNLPPYAYRKVCVREGKKNLYTLEPIPEEAEVVRMVFSWYAQGVGATRIADRLDDMHIPAPRANRWHPDQINRMLRNEHYIGMVRWNARKTTRTVEDGRVKVSHPVADDYLLYPGRHPAIVSCEQWEAVQLRRGKLPRIKKGRQPFNPLAGLMYCANCGAAMIARTYNTKGVARCRPRVLCANQAHCGNASAPLDDVLAELAKVLQAAISDFNIRLKSDIDAVAELHNQKIGRLELRLEELRELEIAQWDAKTKGGMPAHVFDHLNQATVREIEEISAALRDAEAAPPEPINLRERVATFSDAVGLLLVPDAAPKELNELLKACITRIDFSRQRAGNRGHTRRGEEQPCRVDIKLNI